jgi:hypothetical protein
MHGDILGWSSGESLITNVSNQYKRVTTTWSDMNSERSFFGMTSAIWKNNTSQITDLKIEASDGTNPSSFDVGSRITLIGMR